MKHSRIVGDGSYLPSKAMTNHEFAQRLETSDEWIMTRVGIKERHIAEANVATSDLAIEAVHAALSNIGASAQDVEAIIVCTVTPDMMFPSTACIVQDKIGAKGAWGFDLVAACSGFIYGLTVGANLIRSGAHKKVLVVGADTMSRIIDYTDRSTCVLFGDGAGAFLLEPCEPGSGFIGFHNEVDGSGGDFLKMPAGGSRQPASVETVEGRLHYVKQAGQQVFRYATRKLADVCEELLTRYGYTGKDVKLLIPHQANLRIINAAAERLGLAPEQVVINIEKYGNTTAATIPLATRDALQSGRLKKGDLVLFAGVGAGFTVGANLWRWEY